MQIRSETSAAVGAFITLASSLVDKPALHPDLGYCNQGLMENLPTVSSASEQWQFGWIPQACSKMASDADLRPVDMEAWNVTYADCDDPWILCRHKEAPYSIDDLVTLFGRLPVGTRQWVRHFAHLPDASGHAYNSNGNIALFGTVESPLNILIHESGHSLDLQGAFSEKPLSKSSYWLRSVVRDSAVPDRYARRNQVENLAQNVVIATFDSNVPGGFASIEPGWQRILNQYSAVQREATAAGGILKPGGTCTQRLDNSAPVQVGDSTRVRRLNQNAPEHKRSPRLKVIEGREFDTRDLGCTLSHRH